jgi:hypothetical protein
MKNHCVIRFSGALSDTPTNTRCDKCIVSDSALRICFPFFSTALKAAKLSPDLYVPTKHTNLQTQYFYCSFL